MLDVLILVPEITKGMKSMGSKALLDIKKHTKIIEYQIETIQTIDSQSHITVAAGFEYEKIDSVIKKFKRTTSIYNPLYKETNQAESIKLYLETHNPTNLLIINNGILLKPRALTKTSLSGQSKIFVLDKTKENFNLGCTSSHQTEYLFYDLPEPWSECIFLNHQAIDAIRASLKTYDSQQMYLFEIINVLINQNIPIDKHYISKTRIMKITSIKDLNKAKLFI